MDSSGEMIAIFILLVVAALQGYVLAKLRSERHRLLKREAETRTKFLMFSHVLDSISDMVLVKAKGSKIVWANRAFRECYGMSNQQLQGIIDAPFSEPSNTEQYVKDDAFVLESGQTLDIPCEPVTSFDGKVRQYHTVKSPIRDDNGKVIMTVGVSRDIGERLRHEALIREQQQKIVSSAKLSALGEMSGGIAHEINNPVSIIYGKAKQLQRLAGEGNIDVGVVIQIASRIEETAKRIASIVRSLRTIGRDGDSDPFESASMKRIFEDTIVLCKERFQNHQIELIAGDVPEHCTLECRAVQISQLLLNLLNNAHDAVEKKETRRVEVSFKKDGNFCEIRVSDSGDGILPEHVDKVFQPFFTTKEQGRGMGLGLSISRSIAESHHGSLTYHREAGKTSFVLRLPITQKSDTQ